jgi:hypothetical protein
MELVMKTVLNFRVLIITLVLGLQATPLWSKHKSSPPLSNNDWVMVEKNVKLLDGMNYMPILLPIILRNKDALQLTKTQINHLRQWRKDNFVPMVNLMNSILEQKIEFKKGSLDPTVSSEQLVEMQRKSLKSQETLLAIKLSCRKILVESFTEEQWSNFEFVISDDPNLASFLR